MNLTKTKTDKKKNRLKKAIAVAMCAMMTVSCCGISASAATKSVSTSSNIFTKSWEKTKSWNSSSVKLLYGFNTWCTDEDYCKSYNSKTSHTAKVQSGSSSNSESKTAKKGKWTSKAEVPHKSGTVIWKTMY